MKNKIQPTSLLRLFLGIVFISAGLYRVLSWQTAIQEFIDLNLGPAYYLMALTVAIEILGGLSLILNIKTKLVLSILIAFAASALVWAIINFGDELLSKSKELFSFQATPTDFFLHFTYLIILLYLLLK